MATVDLAARRKARAEERGKKEAPSFTFADEDGENERTFTLPKELPGEVLFSMGDVADGRAAALRDTVQLLLGDEQYAQFLDLKPSDRDIMELLNSMDEFYGESVGNSRRSEKSSTSTGKS